MARKVRPPTLTLCSELTNTVLEIGPRCDPPVDNTLTMSVSHCTLGSPVTVLMDDITVRLFVEWLIADEWDSTYTVPDLQTTAVARKRSPEVLDVSVRWDGSGRTRSITLSRAQHRELARFLTEALSPKGWPGWLKPEDVFRGYHGHVWTYVDGPDGQERVAAPCRLCELHKAAQS